MCVGEIEREGGREGGRGRERKREREYCIAGNVGMKHTCICM
jgi:hypothetical protein